MQLTHHDILFTAHHHALLFSSIARSVIHCLEEEKGEILIRKAVRKYGQQRGKRMALRAKKNGHDLTFANYFAYGEWEVPKNEMDFKLIEKNPHARLNVFKCPWYVIWEENNLLDYGKYFCMEIDAALVRGFNPNLEIKINSTRTNDQLPCDFIFKNAGLSLFKMLGLAYKKKIRPGKKAIMDWEYHTGHLYKTLGDVIRQHLGDKADEIMENALEDFSSFFSENHIAAIKKYQDTDFSKLPGNQI